MRMTQDERDHRQAMIERHGDMMTFKEVKETVKLSTNTATAWLREMGVRTYQIKNSRRYRTADVASAIWRGMV